MLHCRDYKWVLSLEEASSSFRRLCQGTCILSLGGKSRKSEMRLKKRKRAVEEINSRESGERTRDTERAAKKKRAAKEPKIDRLSSLPDCLLHHILSFLDMKDVVRTGILSSRWRAISTSVSHLNFYSPALRGDKAANFVRFVDGAIRVNSAPRIHKFRVSLSYHPKYSSQVDAWILFAVGKGVQEVELCFRYQWKVDYTYYLPCCLFNCETLVSLRLKMENCRFSSYNSGTLSKLTSVSLDLRVIRDGFIENVLERCPLLKDLDILSCSCPCVKICSSSSSSSSSLSLKRLSIAGRSFAGLDIDAPNLQVLKIHILQLGKVSIKNMEFLIEASIGFYFDKGVTGEYVTGEYIDSLRSSLSNLRHARVLKLNTTCVQAISNQTFKDTHSYFFKTKYLRITIGVPDYEMRGIANLLWSSPDLEHLVIDFVYSHCISDRECRVKHDYVRDYWESTFPCLVHHLKTIEIAFVYQPDNAMNVLMERILIAGFFLKHAMVLEYMRIRNVDKNWRATVADFLIHFPCASSHAKIRFS